ncbi:hypothetical protein [Xanthomonas arboricola]|uniref:hypothetical protein n=1 Tax=Xanthomonas arboricola TaxID=56448 RepID=UPI0011B01736|nr:hypothetical protein [Xanthomonas arboricola]
MATQEDADLFVKIERGEADESSWDQVSEDERNHCWGEQLKKQLLAGGDELPSGKKPIGSRP